MSLGERINRLRTARNMSQGDLAEALEVSRQSISKWETGMSTPELDKLIRLAELFEVTLDELATGKVSEKPEQQKPVVERQGIEGRKAAGIVLLCLAFAVAMLFTVVWRPLEGIILCLPFLVCGAICCKARKYPGLWCVWALYLMVDGYLRYATGLSWATVRWTLLWRKSWNYTRLVIAWCQVLFGLGLLAVTVMKLRKGRLEWTRRNKRLFLGAATLFILLCLPFPAWIFLAGGPPFSGLVTFADWLRDSLRLGLLTGLLTAAVMGRKKT